MLELGKYNLLEIVRETNSGLFLEDKEGKFKKMIKINKNFYDENISVSHNKNIYKNVLDQYLSEIVS